MFLVMESTYSTNHVYADRSRMTSLEDMSVLSLGELVWISGEEHSILKLIWVEHWERLLFRFSILGDDEGNSRSRKYLNIDAN